MPKEHIPTYRPSLSYAYSLSFAKSA